MHRFIDMGVVAMAFWWAFQFDPVTDWLFMLAMFTVLIYFGATGAIEFLSGRDEGDDDFE